MSTWFTTQRMNFIKAKLSAQGWITRQVLIDKFKISKPQATLDLRAMKVSHPGLMAYNTRKRRYEAK